MGLLTEEQGTEGKSGFTDPLGMGLLGLGTSLMQQSGWRHRPISTAEQWGYAIPAGMQAYAQQAQANAQRDEASALLEQEAQAQAQAQAVAQAEQQAEEQQKMLFTKAVLESKLSEPRKNNLLAMWGINPTEAAKRFDEATAPSDPNVKVTYIPLGIDQDGNPSAQEHQWALMTDPQGNEIGRRYIAPTGGVTEVQKREEEQEFREKKFEFEEMKWEKTLTLGDRDFEQQLTEYEHRVRQEAKGDSLAQQRIGHEIWKHTELLNWRRLTDDRNYDERQKDRKDRLEQWQKANEFKRDEIHAQQHRFNVAEKRHNSEFTQRFGLDERKFSVQQDDSKRDFDEKVREYEAGVVYRSGTETAKKAELDRAYNMAVQKFEENIRKTAKSEGFTEEQIENSVNQFAQNLALRKDQFSKKHALALETFGLSEERFAEQQAQWEITLNSKEFNEDRNFQYRVKDFENRIVQQGIKNDLTAQQITNQVEQFRERFDQQEIQFETTQELKERIFGQRLFESERDFTQEITEYQDRLEQAGEGQILDEAKFKQRLVEHLASVKQHGISNGHSAERIQLAQDGFITQQGQFAQSHGLSVEGLGLSKLRYEADQVHRDRQLAQDAIDQEYKEERAGKKDKQWQDGFDLRVKAQATNLEQQGLSRQQALDIAHANLEFSKFKYQKDSDLRPRTLYGEDARAWAEEQGVLLNKTGMPVVKFDKYGNFEGEVDYIKANKYDQGQLDYLQDTQEKWMTNPDTKAANKLGRLLQSLKTLSGSGTGVGEFAMIYKFMKSLDETSTVLASEFQKASGAGRSLLANLYQWGDNKYRGTQLTKEQQRDIIQAVSGIAHAHLTDTIRPNMKAALDAAKLREVAEPDMKNALPNILEDYFTKNPFKGAAKTTGGVTVQGGPLTVAQEVDLIENLVAPPE